MVQNVHGLMVRNVLKSLVTPEDVMKSPKPKSHNGARDGKNAPAPPLLRPVDISGE